jgi:DNA-binding NarL/FixJ family response regulator
VRGARGDLERRDSVVLDMLLGGDSKTAISRMLAISQSLVTQSVRRIFKRLGVRNLIELGAWAQRAGRMPDER